jgi:hypothetical protein
MKSLTIALAIITLLPLNLGCSTFAPKPNVNSTSDIYEIVFSDCQVKAEIEYMPGLGPVITQKNDGRVDHVATRDYNLNEIRISASEADVTTDYCVLLVNSGSSPILILPNVKWTIRKKEAL